MNCVKLLTFKSHLRNRHLLKPHICAIEKSHTRHMRRRANVRKWFCETSFLIHPLPIPLWSDPTPDNMCMRIGVLLHRRVHVESPEKQQLYYTIIMCVLKQENSKKCDTVERRRRTRRSWHISGDGTAKSRKRKALTRRKGWNERWWLEAKWQKEMKILIATYCAENGGSQRNKKLLLLLFLLYYNINYNIKYYLYKYVCWNRGIEQCCLQNDSNTNTCRKVDDEWGFGNESIRESQFCLENFPERTVYHTSLPKQQCAILKNTAVCRDDTIKAFFETKWARRLGKKGCRPPERHKIENCFAVSTLWRTKEYRLSEGRQRICPFSTWIFKTIFVKA